MAIEEGRAVDVERLSVWFHDSVLRRDYGYFRSERVLKERKHESR